MSNEAFAAYLKSVQDLYPDGIPLSVNSIPVNSNPGIFIVSEEELSNPESVALLENIVTKGMKLTVGSDVVFIEPSKWIKSKAPFILVFGAATFSSLKLDIGSEAVIEGSHAFRTYSLEEIRSNEDKKRAFWLQLKSVMSAMCR